MRCTGAKKAQIFESAHQLRGQFWQQYDCFDDDLSSDSAKTHMKLGWVAVFDATRIIEDY